MKYSEAQRLEELENNRSWTELECIPRGKVETQEQYDYVQYYANHTSIVFDEKCDVKAFESEKGRYLCLGNWFGGAAFYFYFSDKPDGVYETAIRNDSGAIIGYKEYYEEFSYGKYGKIEFD